MLKVDFHIHTISTAKDVEFEFDINDLNKYINEMQLDCIAITNHNIFDKKQFQTINGCVNAKVFPGLEVDIENSHLLIIGDVSDADDLEKSSSELEKFIIDANSSVTFEEFITIFPNYEKYLLIPHYKKHPRMHQSTIKKFNGLIKCGEVPNAKKFSIIIKEDESLVPVVFSDYRIGSKEPMPSRYTYVNSINDGFSNIKLASRLTKYKIEVKTLAQINEEGNKEIV